LIDCVRPTFWTAVLRGLRRRCPRCGEGPLFKRWIAAYERCSACGLVFQPNHGNTWMFIVITDRIPLLFGIGALFFGLRPHGVLQNSAFLFCLAVPLIATMPQRQGMAMALDYLAGRAMSGGG
jgi:ribosomal protein S27AE